MGIKIKLALGLLTALCAGSLSAQDVFKPVKTTDLTPSKRISLVQGAFLFKGATAYVSPQTFVLDPAKKYELSGEFCQKSGKPVSILFGFIPQDAKGANITSGSVLVAPHSIIATAAAAKKGDKVIKVKDASKWSGGKRASYVAFGAKKDFSDLPNRDISAVAAPGIKQNNGVWEITLKAPLKKDVAAGTLVRQHFPGGAFIYTISIPKLDNKWVARKGIISGMAKYGIPGNKLWPGTKKVKLLVYALRGDGTSEFMARNIKVTEVK